MPPDDALGQPPAPIGLFDSGVGGLSVARAVHALMPEQPLLYTADSAYCPYGGRPLPEIRARALAMAGYLAEQGAKLIVVACNTATGAGVEELRARLPLPIVAMEPAIKPAAATTQNGKIAVMATEATLETERFRRLLATYGQAASVIAVPCPGLVEYIERGETDSPALDELLRRRLAPAMAAGVDTIVLGCTHYPFAQGRIEAIGGGRWRVVEPSAAIARQVRRVLAAGGETVAECEGASVTSAAGPQPLRLVTTGDAERVGAVASRLWGAEVAAQHVEV